MARIVISYVHDEKENATAVVNLPLREDSYFPAEIRKVVAEAGDALLNSIARDVLNFTGPVPSDRIHLDGVGSER